MKRSHGLIGDQDSVLSDVASFDTLVPHWFGSTGEGPVEILSIFGRLGERMHVHVTSSESDVAL